MEETPDLSDSLLRLGLLRIRIIADMALLETVLEDATKEFPTANTAVKAILARKMEGLEQVLRTAEHDLRRLLEEE